MTSSLNDLSTLPANSQHTTVEVLNQTPFPVKVFRKLPQGEEQPSNLLEGYRRYVQEATVGEELIVRLACNHWEMARLTTTREAGSCVIGEEVLRSRPSGEARAQVRLDVPVRDAALFLVDERGARKPVTTRMAGGVPVAELPVGSVLQGMEPHGRATYFWLIVTPQGEPNVLGQTFRTGTGWGVVPEQGEVAVFLDLAIGQDASWQPKTAPDEPFFFLFHGDIPDISALLATTRVDFAGPMRTVTAELAAGSTPAKALTLAQVLEQLPPVKGARPRSGSPVLLRAVAGSGTRAVFYEGAGFQGDDFVPDAGALPGGRKVGALKLEAEQSAAGAGLRVLTSLSEDYEDDGKGGVRSISRFRATLVCPSGVEYVEIGAWEDGVALEVGGERHVVGPARTARVKCNPFGRVVIKVEAAEAGAPELMVRTSTMLPGTVVMVYPDAELHQKIANLPADTLHASGIVGARYSADDCGHVQKALRNISRAAMNAHAETAVGVASQRTFDARHMSDPHWVLSIDPKTGKPTYQALAAHEAEQLNAASSAEIHDLDAHLAQSIFSKALNKVGSVVVQTAKSAGKAVTDAAKETGKGVTQAAETTGKGVAQAAQASGDAFVDAGKAIGHGLVVTVHFLEENVPAVRFIVNESKRAAAAIKSVLQAVEVVLEKFIEWVRFLFDWKDIQHTHAVLENTMKGYFQRLKKDVPELKKGLDGFLDGLRAKLGNPPLPTGPSRNHAPATNPTHHGPLEKLEWFLDMLGKHVPGVKGLETTTSKLISSVWTDIERAMAGVNQDLGRFEEELGRLGHALVKVDVQGILDAAKGLAVQLLTVALDVAHAVVDVLLDAVIALMDEFLRVFTGKIEIPVISPLFKTIAGDELSLLGVGTLLMAIPVTIGTKLLTKEAPFHGMDSLAQSRTLDVATAYASGVADVIASFTSVLTTFSAAGPTVGREGSSNATLLTLNRILSVGKMFGYFAGALILRVEEAKTLVMLSSSLRATFQAFYLLDAERAAAVGQPTEVVADAMLGCVKLLAGGMELGEGHGLEGSIVILEGSGAMMELGGLVKNPLVVAVAAVTVSQTILAAGLLQFVRGARM